MTGNKQEVLLSLYKGLASIGTAEDLERIGSQLSHSTGDATGMEEVVSQAGGTRTGWPQAIHRMWRRFNCVAGWQLPLLRADSHPAGRLCWAAELATAQQGWQDAAEQACH